MTEKELRKIYSKWVNDNYPNIPNSIQAFRAGIDIGSKLQIKKDVRICKEEQESYPNEARLSSLRTAVQSCANSIRNQEKE